MTADAWLVVGIAFVLTCLTGLLFAHPAAPSPRAWLAYRKLSR